MKKLKGNSLLLISELYRKLLAIGLFVLMMFLAFSSNKLIGTIYDLAGFEINIIKSSKVISIAIIIVAFIINVLVAIGIKKSRKTHSKMLLIVILAIVFIFISAFFFIYVKSKYAIMPIIINILMLIGAIRGMSDIKQNKKEVEIANKFLKDGPIDNSKTYIPTDEDALENLEDQSKENEEIKDTTNIENPEDKNLDDKDNKDSINTTDDLEDEIIEESKEKDIIKDKNPSIEKDKSIKDLEDKDNEKEDNNSKDLEEKDTDNK